ncbi:MAG: NADH:flavin oxidoreductase [Bdellovibrionota bacterium]
MPSIDVLFRPFPFGKVTLPNRIVMAPMTRSRSPGGVPTEQVAKYYRRRAEGGAGLIITEATIINHKASNGYPAVPQFYGEKALAGWKRVLEEVHAVGGRIIPQIWHTGSIRQTGMEPDPAVPGYAPSPVPHPNFKGKGQIPHEMTQQDIDEVVAAYGESARYAKELGFDGVEIHGAHAYLIDQFFWDVTNQRKDKYGGDLLARSRFAIEVIQAVRAAVGKDFPVVFRFSQWKQGDYSYKIAKTPQELGKFLEPLSNAGVDIFHASTRRFWEPEFEGSDLNLAGWTKKLTGKPSITVGSVGLDTDFISSFAGKAAKMADLTNLLERMERGEFDLVAVGRAFLSEPAWGNKVREGRYGEIKPFTPLSVGGALE